MGWKLIAVVFLVMLWLIWPAIRVPRDNFIRRRIGLFGTYMLIIVGLLCALQVIEQLIGR